MNNHHKLKFTTKEYRLEGFAVKEIHVAIVQSKCNNSNDNTATRCVDTCNVKKKFRPCNLFVL